MNYQPRPLTKLEIEYLTLIAKGLRKAEIAKVLNVSINTADGNIRRLYRQMDVRNAAEAVYEGFMTGYLKVPQ